MATHLKEYRPISHKETSALAAWKRAAKEAGAKKCATCRELIHRQSKEGAMCPLCTLVANRPAEERAELLKTYEGEAGPDPLPWNEVFVDRLAFTEWGWFEKSRGRWGQEWWGPYLYPYSDLGKCSRCPRLGHPHIFRWDHLKSFRDPNERWFFLGFPKQGPERWDAEENLRVSLTGMCVDCYNRLRPVMKLHRQNYEAYQLRRQLNKEITDVRKTHKTRSQAPILG